MPCAFDWNLRPMLRNPVTDTLNLQKVMPYAQRILFALLDGFEETLCLLFVGGVQAHVFFSLKKML